MTTRKRKGRRYRNDRYDDDRCFNCGEHGHWADECPYDDDDDEDHDDDRCFNCGEHGHWADECPYDGFGRSEYRERANAVPRWGNSRGGKARMHPRSANLTRGPDIAAARERLLRVVEHVAAFYVGRSHTPKERLDRSHRWKGMNRVAIVHRARTLEEAEQVETALIRATYGHQASHNISPFSDGAGRHGTNFVYVAYAERSNFFSWAHERTVALRRWLFFAK